jgi:hypothetical protein
MISGKIETAVKNVLFRIISAAILPADCYLADGPDLGFSPATGGLVSLPLKTEAIF